MPKRLWVSFLTLILAVPLALAQQGTSAIKGRVSAVDGSVLPGVTVTIKHQESGVIRTTVTDQGGVYFMSGVTPGMYSEVAELSGFRPVRSKDVRLEVGKTTTRDVTLDMETSPRKSPFRSPHRSSM